MRKTEDGLYRPRYGLLPRTGRDARGAHPPRGALCRCPGGGARRGGSGGVAPRRSLSRGGLRLVGGGAARTARVVRRGAARGGDRRSGAARWGVVRPGNARPGNGRRRAARRGGPRGAGGARSRGGARRGAAPGPHGAAAEEPPLPVRLGNDSRRRAGDALLPLFGHLRRALLPQYHGPFLVAASRPPLPAARTGGAEAARAVDPP